MAGYELGTAEMAGSEIRMVGWACNGAQRWLAPSETVMCVWGWARSAPFCVLITLYGLAESLFYPSGEEGGNFLVQLIYTCLPKRRGRGVEVGTLWYLPETVNIRLQPSYFSFIPFSIYGKMPGCLLIFYWTLPSFLNPYIILNSPYFICHQSYFSSLLSPAFII
jgi:hypothetical protein